MGPGRAGMAPTSGPGWVRNTVKNKAHGESGRDHLGPGMGPGRAQDRTQARVWMAPPRDSNRLLGLSEKGKATFLEAPFASKKVPRGTFCGLPPFTPLLSWPGGKGSKIYVLSSEPKDCNPARPLQESPGPSGPGIPKESQKSLPGPSGPGVQKVSETVSKQSPESQNTTISVMIAHC